MSIYNSDKFRWQFTPMSKMIGTGVARPKSSINTKTNNNTQNIQKTQNIQNTQNLAVKLDEHPTNSKVRDSGYLTNFSTGDGKGWRPEKILDSKKFK